MGYISRNHESLMVNTDEEKNMLERIYKWLETRFLNPTYQSGLESFIAAQSPKNSGDIERLERLYSSRRAGGML